MLLNVCISATPRSALSLPQGRFATISAAFLYSTESSQVSTGRSMKLASIPVEAKNDRHIRSSLTLRGSTASR